MKVDELFGFLLTFEISLDGKPEKKKGISLQSSIEEEHDDLDRESEESFADYISFLSKQFTRVIKISEKRPKKRHH